MRVSWSPHACSQILEIFEYIARDRPLAAEHLVERFAERVQLLAEFPLQGPVWGAGRRRDLHEITFEGHRIVYRVTSDEVSVLSVRHARMQPETLDPLDDEPK